MIAANAALPDVIERLERELQRARVVAPDELPAAYAHMGSRGVMGKLVMVN